MQFSMFLHLSASKFNSIFGQLNKGVILFSFRKRKRVCLAIELKVVYNFTISFMTRQIYVIKLYLINLIN